MRRLIRGQENREWRLAGWPPASGSRNVAQPDPPHLLKYGLRASWVQPILRQRKQWTPEGSTPSKPEISTGRRLVIT